MAISVTKKVGTFAHADGARHEVHCIKLPDKVIGCRVAVSRRTVRLLAQFLSFTLYNKDPF